jgi:hypothetical protein
LNVTLKVLAVVMLMAVLSRSASAQTGLGHIGPTAGEVVDESSGLKAGKRVKLQGKERKDKPGKLSFRVSKIKKDYGPCQQ